MINVIFAANIDDLKHKYEDHCSAGLPNRKKKEDFKNRPGSVTRNIFVQPISLMQKIILMKTVLFLILLNLCTLCQIFGQTLRGKIFDETQTPIPGAYVIHLQSDHHAHTNELGYFILNEAGLGDTLQIMHLGFQTIKVVVQDLDNPMEIKMEPAIFLLDNIVVGQNVKATNLLSDIDLRTNPVSSSQEVLRKVPGLFIGQHAGGGKAEQIFLRGFDIDHGTDINISVDGLPVNMVSHAHGQGYADLHFLIPETVDFIDFGKGPYYADKGNFTTAGYVNLKTKDRLENSLIDIEYGRFNTMRVLGMWDLLNTENRSAYVSAEYLLTDGPFESSQNFNRTNIFAKYTSTLPTNDKITFIASHFKSKWDASGQIPVRAVESGQISRFGAIDDTEGGSTGRSNIAFFYNKFVDEKTFVKNSLYYSAYDFELYSNFTFFLNDPINGDQIRQKEKRQIIGLESEWNHSFFLNRTATLLQAGVGLRYDNVGEVELSRSVNRRTTLSNIQLGDVNEANFYGYANAEFDMGNWLVQPSVRVDFLHFNYVDKLASLYSSPSNSKVAISPKLNIVYNASNALQLFFKSGVGFHSNDSRLVLQKEVQDILPLAYGADLGTIIKPTARMFANLSLWYLFLEQEFVYVGDEGVVEPSGRTRRLGVDLEVQYQLSRWLFADADFNYAYARSIDEPEKANRIPLAPLFTSVGGLTLKKNGFSTGVRFRYMGDRPANEENSIVARGYFITDLFGNFERRYLGFGLAIENLFNQDWNETQFATESRLNFEPAGVEEIHFTPGTPFFLKASIQYKF